MSLAPITATQQIVSSDGTVTPQFKLYLDALTRAILPSYKALTIGDGGATPWDLSNNPVAVVVLTQNILIIPTGLTPGSMYRLTLVQDGTGSRTVTWSPAFKWPAGTAPVLSAAANAVDELWISCDGTNLKGIVGTKDLR